MAFIMTSKCHRDAGESAIDARERRLLAPYAFPSRLTQGRRYPEPDHPYRGPFQRDRDRILHSAAFRRLSGKMQVFTGEMGDYHRTRLTHTMEVSSVARTIGRVLRLNEDLIEGLALLHDLGHPPFGHAGEDALQECLADHGGFSHNAFGLTLVEELEQRYPRFPGLNLTYEMREGQQTRIHKQESAQRPLLEVQVVEAADGIAYNAHDVDDALKLELVNVSELLRVPLVDGIVSRLKQEDPDLPTGMFRQEIVRKLLDLQIGSLVRHCLPFLERCGWQHPREPRESHFVVDMEPEVAAARRELAEFLYHRIYRHERLLAVRQRAQAEIHWLFEWFVGHSEWLPDPFQQRAKQVGLHRSVGEYLAGMTDRFCREQFRRYSEGRME